MDRIKRLVIKSKAGSYYLNDTARGVMFEPHEIEPHQRRLLLKRLYAYEDTDLTPEQIRELAERDTGYFAKTSIFDHESVVCKCGNDIEKDSGFKFCPYCGQRIKWED